MRVARAVSSGSQVLVFYPDEIDRFNLAVDDERLCGPWAGPCVVCLGDHYKIHCCPKQSENGRQVL